MFGYTSTPTWGQARMLGYTDSNYGGYSGYGNSGYGPGSGSPYSSCGNQYPCYGGAPSIFKDDGIGSTRIICSPVNNFCVGTHTVTSEFNGVDFDSIGDCDITFKVEEVPITDIDNVVTP